MNALGWRELASHRRSAPPLFAGFMAWLWRATKEPIQYIMWYIPFINKSRADPNDVNIWNIQEENAACREYEGGYNVETLGLCIRPAPAHRVEIRRWRRTNCTWCRRRHPRWFYKSVKRTGCQSERTAAALTACFCVWQQQRSAFYQDVRGGRWDTFTVFCCFKRKMLLP